MKELDYDDLGRALGWRLKCYRLAAGWSQEDAAKAVGWTRNTLSAHEVNARAIPLWRLLALASLYGVRVERLLAHTEEVDTYVI